jgi:hypothetical protein
MHFLAENCKLAVNKQLGTCNTIIDRKQQALCRRKNEHRSENLMKRRTLNASFIGN